MSKKRKKNKNNLVNTGSGGSAVSEQPLELENVNEEDSNKTSFGKKFLVVFLCLFIYGLVSCIVLVKDHYREKEYATYGMGTQMEYPSEVLGKEPSYRQYFYTPKRMNGIDIQFATYMTKPKKDMYISFYDAETDELIGTSKIKHKTIIDNAYARIVFKDYRLEEGKHFYFEVNSTLDEPESIVYWMGTNTSAYADMLTYNGEELEDTGVVFRLIYEYNGRGLIKWIFISVIFALILNAVVVKLFGEEKIRYQVTAGLVQMCMIIALLWGYAKFII